MTPRLSVVMTMFNEERFVGAAISSVLSQTFADFELIVVDDGSTDGGVAVVEGFSDPRIRLIRQANEGLASALNYGVREARAEWIARHDADDISLADRFALQLSEVKGTTDLVLIGTNAVLTDEEGDPVLTTEFPSDDASLRKILFSGVNPFNHGSVIFRRDTMLAAGGYRPQFRQSQDYDLWLRLSEAGRLGNLEQPLYLWRMRRGGVGVAKSETQRDFGRLALLCAHHRRESIPEPPLEIGVARRSTRVSFLSALRNTSGAASYDFSLAKLLLRGGNHARARSHVWAVMRAHPFNVYAWLLLLLTYVPERFARGFWNLSTRLYRRMIWRRSAGGTV